MFICFQKLLFVVLVVYDEPLIKEKLVTVSDRKKQSCNQSIDTIL